MFYLKIIITYTSLRNEKFNLTDKESFNIHFLKKTIYFKKNISFRYTKISKIGGVNVKRIFFQNLKSLF